MIRITENQESYTKTLAETQPNTSFVPTLTQEFLLQNEPEAQLRLALISLDQYLLETLNSNGKEPGRVAAADMCIVESF